MRKSYALRAALAMNDQSALTVIAEIVKGAGVDVVASASNGADMVSILYGCMPDFLITDMILPGLDAYGLLKKIGEMRLETMPVMIVLSIAGMEEHERWLTKGGVYRVFEKPVLASALSKALDDADIMDRVAPQNVTLERVRELLWSLGLNPRLAGTAYLTTAILLTSRDLRLTEALTTRLYPMVAKRYGVDGRSVEQCMRRAIESAWSTGAIAAQHNIFGDSIDEQRGKPMCSELIVRVVDFLKLKECKDG